MRSNDIAVGKCYATTQGQVRYVESIESGIVKYRSRGKRWAKDWEARTHFDSVSLDKFAGDVSAEIACHADLT